MLTEIMFAKQSNEKMAGPSPALFYVHFKRYNEDVPM